MVEFPYFYGKFLNFANISIKDKFFDLKIELHDA